MPISINPFTGRADDIGVPQIKKARAPTTADYQFPTGQQWVDTSAGDIWFLASVSGIVGTWEKVVGGTTGVSGLDGDTGSATPTAGIIDILGGEGMDVTATGSAVTVAGEDATTSNKGIASFATADFGVTAGAASLNDAVVKSVTTDSGAMTPSGHSFSMLGGEGMNVTHAAAVATIAGEDATSANKGIASFDAYDFVVGTGNVTLRPGSAVYFVGKWGNDSADGLTYSSAKLTVQAAVTAAPVNASILVYPGTYTETVTFDQNNQILIGMGCVTNTIITQADANVIDFNTRSDCQTRNLTLSVTAATTAIHTFTGTTGTCLAKDCVASMTTSAAIVAAAQPSCGTITGTGELTVSGGTFVYSHTGNGGGTAQKGAFVVGTGGTIHLGNIHEATITTSGTELVTSIALDLATTGIIEMHDCSVNITGSSTLVVGLGYLGGTGITHEFFRNRIEIDATGATNAYGFFAADTATTSRFFFNHVHVENATNNYSYYVGTGSTVISHLNDIVAASGIQGSGTFNSVDSFVDGSLTLTGTLHTAQGVDVASANDMTLGDGNFFDITGTTTINTIVTKGIGTFVTLQFDGVLQLTHSADLFLPTAANITTAAGDIAVFYEYASGDWRCSSYTRADGSVLVSLTDHGVLVGSGAGAITALAVGTDGQILVGDSADDPAWETLTSSDSTIAFTTGAGTLSIQARAGTESVTGVLELATGAETTTGTSTALAVHPDGLDTRLGAQTANGVIYGGGGAGNNLAATAEGATGTVLVGATGSAPSWSATPSGLTSVTATTVYGTTFDTNVAAAACTLTAATLASDGTDANIPMVVDGKGTGPLQTTLLGIGTATAPHSGTGTCLMAIEGANASASGPQVQFTTASDDYPLLSIVPWQHDAVSIGFDCYNVGAGTWTSSDAGSNYILTKDSDSLKVFVDDSIAAGSAVSPVEAWSINTSRVMSAHSINAPSFDGAYSVSVNGGYVSNLAVTYASNTLSIAGGEGSALSATNTGYVIMQDKSSPGVMKRYTVTANQGFLDDTGASEIIGNLFGLVTGVAITEDLPFFIYAVTSDDEASIAFMISRIPHAKVSPAAANIGAPDDAVADAEADFFSFDNIDETLYDANPCICIGSFRMRMSASDDWTVQALSVSDGIGQYNDATEFTVPTGQWGAGAGSYLKANGGTAPVFTSYTFYSYYIKQDGSLRLLMTCAGDAGQDGVGAVSGLIVTPYKGNQVCTCSGVIVVTEPTNGTYVGRMYYGFPDANAMGVSDVGNNGMQWADFANGNRSMEFQITYQVAS